MTKKELRIKFKEIRKRVLDKKDKSISICKQIISSGLLTNVKVLALYSGINDEVDLSFLFEYAKENNIVVCFPKVDSINTMEFFEVDSLDLLKEQHFDIKEPVETCNTITNLEIDLMIVPLLAFDNEGNRLGYGKGYYDRYFNRGGKYKKIGVAFKEQKCFSLKNVVNDFDVKLDGIYTD